MSSSSAPARKHGVDEEVAARLAGGDHEIAGLLGLRAGWNGRAKRDRHQEQTDKCREQLAKSHGHPVPKPDKQPPTAAKGDAH
jgi:hypothetical protein